MIEHLKAYWYHVRTGRSSKERMELRYWAQRHGAEGELRHDHYEWFYTGEFGLTRQDYADKRVLDIGCGPRGSLEWANGAAQRIGLDPLVEQYRSLGIDEHRMCYVASGAENVPFPDGHFDIVAAFNSLDHVENVDAAICEMTRVTKAGGIALVIVEVNHPPTTTEPHSLEWSLFGRFMGWSVETEKRTSIGNDHNVYASYRRGGSWMEGPGVLGGRLRRLGAGV